MNKKIILIVLGILLLSTVNGLAVNYKSSLNDTECWALLIAGGIYADHYEQNLQELLVIVDDLYDTLISSGWKSDHIKVIKGKDATVINIINGFKWLDKMDDGNDITLVYISTHGTSIPGPLDIDIPSDIPPLDEKDGCDEVLAGYWSFAHPLSGTIWDDEINLLISRLDSKATCLIVYSCQSGGFNDSIFWNDKGKVVLTACQEDESPGYNFLYYLIDGLRGYADKNIDGIVTVKEVYEYISCRVGYHPLLYHNYDDDFPLTTYDKNMEYKNTYNICRNNDINNKLYTKNKNQQSSIICGYITDINNGNPIEKACIFVWYEIQNNYFDNITYSNSLGFYSINVHESTIYMTIDANNYYNEKIDKFYINDYETIWKNVSLYKHLPETSIVCGYIIDEYQHSIENADIYVHWKDDNNHYESKSTHTNTYGFYSVNISKGLIDISIYADGFFDKHIYDFYINDYETIWKNVSLFSIPDESSILCGYITDSETGEPINADIYLTWCDNQSNTYYNRTKTNQNGYYKFHVFPGEIYLKIFPNYSYNYVRTYRNDVRENEMKRLNFNLDKKNINVFISKPLQAIYVSNQRIIPFYNTILIGDIEIEALVHYFWLDEPAECTKVEFYIDDVLKDTDTTFPYTYTWDERSFKLRHTIKIIAYDDEGSASDEISVWKL